MSDRILQCVLCLGATFAIQLPTRSFSELSHKSKCDRSTLNYSAHKEVNRLKQASGAETKRVEFSDPE